MIDPTTDRVLITGAAGAIGTALRNGLRPACGICADRYPPDRGPGQQRGTVVTDIGDRAALERMMSGREGRRVHDRRRRRLLAGRPVPRQRARRVRRVRSGAARRRGAHRRDASSNHAFGCYPITEHVTPALPPRPDSLYGAFKVFGETMLREYFERHGLRSVSLRIGTSLSDGWPIDQRSLATWLSPGDVARLVDCALRHSDPGCLVVNGYSNNTRLKNFDPNWEFLGYQPQDNAEDHVEMLRSKGVDVDGPWEWPEHGGSHARAPERRPR